MKAIVQLAGVMVLCVWSCFLAAQETPTPGATPPPAAAASDADQANANTWKYNLTVDGYIVPDGVGYASPYFTADHNWLHLEARYNYENLHTGSLWAGYNFAAGKTLQLAVTPMIGGVFGDTTGIAPGCEFSLTYKKAEFSSSNEYVFDTTAKAGSFFYSWPELTFSPVSWLKVGGVAQHTKAIDERLSTQRGFLVGVSVKNVEFTTYVFDPDKSNPTVVVEMGYSFGGR